MSKNVFECPLCMAMTENLDKHLRAEHPDSGIEVGEGQLSLFETYAEMIPTGTRSQTKRRRRKR